MSDPPGEILFLRVPPRGLVKPVGGARKHRLSSVFASNGFCGRVGKRGITCFWVGMGRRVRVPGSKLLERMSSGGITEIIDIGCGGALDPTLRRGDLVLSSVDIPFNGDAPVAVRRRPELGSFLQEVSAKRGISFCRAPILTHERLIASRDERIGLFDSSGCVAVQMEQVWFLHLMQSILAADCFHGIWFTHLVLITDAVPHSGSRRATARSAWDALTGYAFPGGNGGIASLRREVLSRWPAI